MAVAAALDANHWASLQLVKSVTEAKGGGIVIEPHTQAEIETGARVLASMTVR